LSDLEKLGLDEVSLVDLINADLVKSDTRAARVILCGEITRKVTVRGLAVTKGAKAAIEAAGGAVIDSDK
jgi:large subunit ribosomal protein L15